MPKDLGLFGSNFCTARFSQVIFMLGHRHHHDQSEEGCASSTNRISKYSQRTFCNSPVSSRYLTHVFARTRLLEFLRAQLETLPRLKCDGLRQKHESY